MINTPFILADYPAYIIYDGKLGDFQLSEDNGSCRTCPVEIRVRGFSKKYSNDYLDSFTIGFDEKDGYWAYGNAAMLSDSKRAKGVCFGFDLGDTIKIEGKLFTIEAAPNNNIKLVPVSGT
jgi:hypothetical protein